MSIMRVAIDHIDSDSADVIVRDTATGTRWRFLITAPRATGTTPGIKESVSFQRNQDGVWHTILPQEES